MRIYFDSKLSEIELMILVAFFEARGTLRILIRSYSIRITEQTESRIIKAKG